MHIKAKTFQQVTLCRCLYMLYRKGTISKCSPNFSLLSLSVILIVSAIWARDAEIFAFSFDFGSSELREEIDKHVTVCFYQKSKRWIWKRKYCTSQKKHLAFSDRLHKEYLIKNWQINWHMLRDVTLCNYFIYRHTWVSPFPELLLIWVPGR